MIRLELDEQTAVDLHALVVRIREVNPHDLDERLRATDLALAGGLRAHGWTPTDGGWVKLATRGRR